ncbi:MAG: GNAT family N-acetyltransferase [Deltaproteobacteria bacterium]|nr:GNAT family N-acetyltransferase [Deltaproteobacteria bacterium]
MDWEDKIVSPAEVIDRIEPGMKIFLGTGVAEPLTLIRHIMSEEHPNLRDLELIQIVSLGELITMKELHSQKYRLKTFFSGWVASEAISEGLVDLIPSRFARIPELIESRQLPIDAVFIQITPPNEAGYCGLGVAVDVARQAIDQARFVVGEINTQVPRTFGDTFIHVSDFDFFVKSDNEPLYFERWPVDEVFDQVAANVASVIEDGSCLCFSVGPIYEALGRHLVHKRNLGIHTPFFTDSLMELVKSGAVTNRNKPVYRGKSLTSYAFGTKELMSWLDRNPMIEFQGIDTVFSPIQIGRNPRFIAVIPARKVDISGTIAMHIGKGAVASTPGEAADFINGAELSRGGCTIFALPSRNLKGQANILLSVEEFPNLFSLRESVDMVVTEYGAANMKGRTVRERAQALIDIAHPEDRQNLVLQAKEKNIIYQDQIYLPECAFLYPAEISEKQTFRGGTEVKFRHIRPSDEEEMRRLFYRFSDENVYYRYFSPIKIMPHAKMQQYVNVDCNRTISIVALIGPPEQEHIIAEARFVKDIKQPYGDVAFVVDEKYQGRGIAQHLYQMLIRLAKERGLRGFTADVLVSNKSMMKVFEKGGLHVNARLAGVAYELTIPFGKLE